MKQLLLASNNQDKALEFRELLTPLSISLVTLKEIPGAEPVVEDAETLEDNALKKARAAFRHTGIASVADDTGLEVFYLNDAPGVYSSRYAGPGATYADNVKKLLERMRGVPPRRRAARFRCVLAFVVAPDKEYVVEGSINGTITEQPRGHHGFGYDPIFLPAGESRTFAEMDLRLKNAISHRGQAIRKFIDLLQQIRW
jgi:XTP/dITP diphosphohydrolase